MQQKIISHDASKYLSPEYKPYILTTWKYKCQREGIDFQVNEFEQEQMHQATIHHVKTNKHHPEFWSKEEKCINKDDRDKPISLIDSTEMPMIYIAEMVCDWLAVSEERGSSVKDWADSNINIRWKFNQEQIKLIYFLIEEGLKVK